MSYRGEECQGCGGAVDRDGPLTSGPGSHADLNIGPLCSTCLEVAAYRELVDHADQPEVKRKLGRMSGAERARLDRLIANPRRTRPNFIPDGATDALSAIDWGFVRRFPGGPVAYFRQLGYSAKDAVKIAAMRLTHRNPQDAQEAFAGQGSRGEQIAGGQMDGMRSRVVQGDPGVPAAASGPRATDGSEGFPVTNPPRLTGAKCANCGHAESIDDDDRAASELLRTSTKPWRRGGEIRAAGRDLFCEVCASRNDASVMPLRRNDGTSHAGATRSDVRSPTSTRTEVRSPTSTSTEVRSPTSTSTQAHTSGNVTVTGGAGAGANTHVTLIRPNPALILVHALNPRPPAEVERAWCKFHQRDQFSGTIRNVGQIRGTPAYTFALGRCVDVDLGRGPQRFTPRPWLVCSPGDDSLWIVAEEPMKLGSGIAGMRIRGVTYAPTASSGKDRANFRHRFESPLPEFSPVGNPNYCRAVQFSGGGYRVAGEEWIYS